MENNKENYLHKLFINDVLGLLNPGNSSDGSSGSAPAPKVKEKDVNFYDYDGTLLHSYTVAEAQKLTELPELPTQEGLICQGWNYDLETIKEYNRAVDVGATYITDDGKTRLYIEIAAEGRMDVPLHIQQTVSNGVGIDWGDGSGIETISGTGEINTSHTYERTGKYTISLDVTDGCELTLGYRATSVFEDVNSLVGYARMLKKIEIGHNVMLKMNTFRDAAIESITVPIGTKGDSDTIFPNLSCSHLKALVLPCNENSWYLGQSSGSTCLKMVSIPKNYVGTNTLCFRGSTALERIVIPLSMKLADSAFYQCASLTHVLLPESMDTIPSTLFYYCENLTSVAIPESVTEIGSSAFTNCKSLSSIRIPKNVASIAANAFSKCVFMRFYDFTKHTAVPTLSSTSAFTDIPSDCEIRVPAALADEWKAATNWSTYADKIVAV